MKRTMGILMATVFLLCIPALAQVKPCDELKNEIEEKLKAKGGSRHGFSLIVPNRAFHATSLFLLLFFFFLGVGNLHLAAIT